LRLNPGKEGGAVAFTLPSTPKQIGGVGITDVRPARMLLWRYRTGDAINASPTVDNGTVYIGSDGFSLYAIRAADGSLVWQFQTGALVRSSASFGP
jgi:hypothetical protein